MWVAFVRGAFGLMAFDRLSYIYTQLFVQLLAATVGRQPIKCQVELDGVSDWFATGSCKQMYGKLCSVLWLLNEKT